MNINDAQAVFGCVGLTKMSKWSTKLEKRDFRHENNNKIIIKWQKTPSKPSKDTYVLMFDKMFHLD